MSSEQISKQGLLEKVGNKKISFVLGTFNRKVMLKLAISSIRSETKDIPHEIIVIDGGSTDRSLKWLLKQKDIITIIQHNRGTWNNNAIVTRSWGYFMNLGFKCAEGKYICMLSDDCLLVPNSIRNALKLFEEKLIGGAKVGACAFYFRDWPDTKNYYINKLSNITLVNHGLFLREALIKIQFINETNYEFYYGDYDLSLRLDEAGYDIIDSPRSFVEHTLHADNFTRKSNITKIENDFVNFKEKWAKKFPDLQKNIVATKYERDFFDVNKTVDEFKIIRQLRKLNLKYMIIRLQHSIKIRERINNLFYKQ